jgi:lipopolysaccharide biosynthesis glycosyltransferase
MNIVCACDEKFFFHTATMLCSLLENNRVEKIFLLHGKIQSSLLDELSLFIESYNTEFSSCLVKSDDLNQCKVDRHASVANYFRLLIPEIIPSEIERVLYLDSDLIIRKPIDDLWEIDLDNKDLAAVENLGFEDHYRLGIPPGRKYFNSGVMLLDLNNWREKKIHYQVLDYLRKNPGRIKLWDQDGLNAVLYENWLELSLTWNAQHKIFLEEEYKSIYLDITEDPAIVHFTGNGFKPWQEGVNHPFRGLYDTYRKKTPWPKYSPQKMYSPWKLFIDKMKRQVRKIIDWLVKLDKFWRFSAFFFDRVDRLILKRKSLEQKRKTELQNQENFLMVRNLVPDLKVNSGPFEGLDYSGIEMAGSSFPAKLLGTYEAELHNIIQEIISNKYPLIVNIGCAEGYYSVGLARKLPDAEIYAYDVDLHARRLLQKMTIQNQVEDRVIINRRFSLEDLKNFHQFDSGMLLCDCEGWEREIFSENSPDFQKLEKFDILMELHEFIHPGLSDYIENLFSSTHKIQSIRSVGDFLRPRYYSTDLIASIPIDKQISLLSEYRPAPIEWFWMKKL